MSCNRLCTVIARTVAILFAFAMAIFGGLLVYTGSVCNGILCETVDLIWIIFGIGLILSGMVYAYFAATINCNYRTQAYETIP